MNTKVQNSKLFFPINIIMIFLLTTLFLYFLGPVKWKIQNSIVMIIVVVIFYISYYIGYVTYIKKHKLYYIKNFTLKKISVQKKKYLFRISSIYNIVFNILLAQTMGGISLNKILSPGLAYSEKLSFDYLSVNQSLGKIVQILSYFGVLLYFYYPIGLIYYKKFKIKDKILFYISLLTTVLYYINFGTFKGLGDLGIIYLAIRTYEKIFVNRRNKNNRKNLKIYIILSLLLITFVSIQSSRANTFKNKNIVNRHIKKFVEYESPNINYGLKAIIFYYTHAYTGLYYSLSLPFEWTYGLGNSRALTQISEKYLGINISQKTYLQRIEDKYGWPNGMTWSTVFPWIASDCTYYLVPLVMYLLGAFLAKLYLEIVYKQNMISLVLYCQMFIFSFYIPANNQLFQSKISFFGMIGLIFVYLFRREK